MALIETSDLLPGIRQILFNRPEKLNALSTPLMREFETALIEAAADNSRRVFDMLERIAKPVICAVDGFALGGGFEIALCCDILILADTAQLGLPEGRLGLCPGGGGTQRLVRAVGKYAASDLLLAGWRLSAQRALQLGIAADVVPAEEMDEAILRRARACLKVAPLAAAEMKRLLREGASADIETAKSLEQGVLFRLYSTADGQERMEAFPS